MAETTSALIPWLLVLGGVFVMGVGWLIVRSVFRLTTKLTLLGCAVILGIGFAMAFMMMVYNFIQSMGTAG